MTYFITLLCKTDNAMPFITGDFNLYLTMADIFYRRIMIAPKINSIAD